MEPHFQHVLPYLDDYLQTLGVADQLRTNTKGAAGVQKGTSRTRGNKIVALWKEGVEGAETPLNKLRQRIVIFLGSLGGLVNRCLVETGPAAVHAAKMVAWDSKRRLEFVVPFPDMKPSIHLGGKERERGGRRKTWERARERGRKRGGK